MDEPADPERRPFGLVLLVALLLAYSALAIPFVLDVPGVVGAGLLRLVPEGDADTAMHIVLSAVAAVAAVGLWLRRRWGWVAAMLLAGSTLAVELVLYFRGEAALRYLAVATLIALYLNSAALRPLFFAEEGEEDRVPA